MIVFPDEPIERVDQDVLGRQSFIENLIRTIRTWPSRAALVIGVFGSWGEGKTSILNMLEEQLALEESVLVVRFDPWYFNSQEQLLTSFLDSIYETLSRIPDRHLQTRLRDWFNKYRRRLSFLPTSIPILGPSWLSLLYKVARRGLQYMPETPDQLKKQIAHELRDFRRKLVVLIDDLDRVSAEEARFVIKLVRLCTDFPNFVYVLACDKRVLIELLGQEFGPPDQFLQKFVQVDLPLPQIELDHIDAFINQAFSDISEELQIAWDDVT